MNSFPGAPCLVKGVAVGIDKYSSQLAGPPGSAAECCRTLCCVQSVPAGFAATCGGPKSGN